MTTVKQPPARNPGQGPESQDQACSGQWATRDCPYCTGPETD